MEWNERRFRLSAVHSGKEDTTAQLALRFIAKNQQDANDNIVIIHSEAWVAEKAHSKHCLTKSAAVLSELQSKRSVTKSATVGF